ncbi:MAG: NTP transferase domain-containing protein, partial [Gammaproteobacteria bacterium]|nr:NTP transferase domain-containing protein [Gammaproteobacteria bacterium]
MEVLILAAGRGRRLRPLTDSTPKALLQVGAESLIERHLRRLAAQGFGEVVINLAWLGEQIRAQLGDGRRFNLRIRYSEEPAGALETGGGIARALRQLRGDPFLVINADILCDFDFASLGVAEA